MNSITIIGRLGADPELKHTQSGHAVVTLSVATTEYGKDAEGNRQDSTEWHRVNVWRQTAEACAKYLKKGSQVAIEGRIQTRSWEDKDGQKRYSTEIVARNVEFLGGKSSGNQDETSNNTQDFEPEAAVPF